MAQTHCSYVRDDAQDLFDAAGLSVVQHERILGYVDSVSNEQVFYHCCLLQKQRD